MFGTQNNWTIPKESLIKRSFQRISLQYTYFRYELLDTISESVVQFSYFSGDPEIWSFTLSRDRCQGVPENYYSVIDISGGAINLQLFPLALKRITFFPSQLRLLFIIVQRDMFLVFETGRYTID
jgi:hypothetical protein